MRQVDNRYGVSCIDLKFPIVIEKYLLQLRKGRGTKQDKNEGNKKNFHLTLEKELNIRMHRGQERGARYLASN